MGIDVVQLKEIIIEHVDPKTLIPHPRNAAIYGNESLDDLEQRIATSGWIKTIVATPSNRINSGHRRVRVAIKLGIALVPVERRVFESEEEELEALLLENDTRDKTPEQRVREGDAWKEIEKNKGLKRMSQAAILQRQGLENFPDPGKGDARDKVADRIGFGSGRSYEKAAMVVGIADGLTGEDKTEEAQILLKVLNTKSVDAAFKIASKPDAERHEVLDALATGKALTVKEALASVEPPQSSTYELSRVQVFDAIDAGILDAEEDEEDEEDDEERELTEEDRYLTAIDNGTTEYYHADLRQVAFQRDQDEREERKRKEEQMLIRDAVKERRSTIPEWYTLPSKGVEIGQWWKLGDHLLYCGDSSDPGFIGRAKEVEASFAFADPPYNAGVEEWDHDFEWKHDYLSSIAPIVAVTPGISAIKDFMRETNMPYKWSMSYWINNGMTRGALGFGNWIYVALFTSGASVFRNEQDLERIDIDEEWDKEPVSITGGDRDPLKHKGRKPIKMMGHIIRLFTQEKQSIIDPFLGTGTTLIACEKEGRVCIGAELSVEYCESIIKRWERMTEREVVLI